MMESKTKFKCQGVWRLSRRCVLAAPEKFCKNSKPNSALFYGRSEDAAPTKIHGKALVQCMMESKTKSKYQGVWRLSRRCVLAAPEKFCKNSKPNSALFYGRSEDAAPTKIHGKALVQCMMESKTKFKYQETWKA